MSIMETEIIPCFESSFHSVWSKRFISRRRIVDYISWDLRIYSDNSSSAILAKNHVSGSQVKILTSSI